MFFCKQNFIPTACETKISVGILCFNPLGFVTSAYVFYVVLGTNQVVCLYHDPLYYEKLFVQQKGNKPKELIR